MIQKHNWEWHKDSNIRDNNRDIKTNAMNTINSIDTQHQLKGSKQMVVSTVYSQAHDKPLPRLALFQLQEAILSLSYIIILSHDTILNNAFIFIHYSTPRKKYYKNKPHLQPRLSISIHTSPTF